MNSGQSQQSRPTPPAGAPVTAGAHDTVNPPVGDHYAVLEVSQHASPFEIEQAFEGKKWDLVIAAQGDEIDSEAFRRIHIAYEMLADPRRRTTYTELWLQYHSQKEIHGTIEVKRRREQERLASADWHADERRSALVRMHQRMEALVKLEEGRAARAELCRRQQQQGEGSAAVTRQSERERA